LVSICRKTTVTVGILPPEVSLVVPSKVPLVFNVWAADVVTLTRASRNTKMALPSKRLADCDWLLLKEGCNSRPFRERV
jgi:hypothetical protein